MARFALGGPRVTERPVLAVFRALLALAGTLFVLLALLYSGYIRYTNLEQPDVEVAPSTFTVDETGRELSYGRSRLRREGALWHLRLMGSPAEVGDAHGRLTSRLLLELDERVRDQIGARFGAWPEAWTAAMLLRWDYRGADRYFDEPAREELAALASAMPEVQVENASAYHRLFLYQCFHSLVQRLDDVVIEGNAFAVAPKRSGGSQPGNLVIGRSLSIDLGHEFKPDPVVTVYRPDGRYPFVSVGWAGLMGVVTGINARGIFVALNAARTDDPLVDGAPLPIVLRRVLEQADSLERAVELLREAEISTAGIVLIGDGTQRKAVVLEVSARDREHGRVLRGEGDSMVWATDHMLHDAFESDLQNDWVRRYTSSGYRFQRLEELLEAEPVVTPQRAVAVLRDRRGLDSTKLGLGNRNALESLSTTHAVVVDATAMVMWVGEGPSSLGRFQAFDLVRLLGDDEATPAPLEDLPADPALYSEEFRDYREALEFVDHARQLLAKELPERALWSAQVALALAPDVGDLHRLLGDIERELGHTESAIKHYRRYLELVPGRRRDQVRVEGILAELES